MLSFHQLSLIDFLPSRVYINWKIEMCARHYLHTPLTTFFFNPLLLIHRAYGNWMKWKKFISMMTFSEIIFWYDENINQFRFELVNLFFAFQYSAYGHFPSLSLRLNLHKGEKRGWFMDFLVLFKRFITQFEIFLLFFWWFKVDWGDEKCSRLKVVPFSHFY